VRPQEAGSEQAPDLQDAHIVPFSRYSNGKPKDKAPSISAALRAQPAHRCFGMRLTG
jgi:hypothetical protein